jgi:HAD superfamily hydrolase (TIGR01509 family)
VFDRDQTLLHYDEAGLVTKFRQVLPDLELAHLYEVWSSLTHDPSAAPSTDTFTIRSFWTALVAKVGGTDSDVDELARLTEGYDTAFSQYPDTTPCLLALRRRGFKLALLTNHPLTNVRSTLRRAGLEPEFFDAIVNALPIQKPAPAAYHRVAAELGLRPEECMFVDDEILNVRGAGAVGMHGVLIDRTRACESNESTVHSLHEVVKLLRVAGTPGRSKALQAGKELSA